MTAYQFMGDSPWLTFFLAMLVYSLVRSVFFMLRQPLRAMNIRKHGWPPAHCDADGDYKQRRCPECEE